MRRATKADLTVTTPRQLSERDDPPVSSFPWETLIIVAGPVTASLGAVFAKGHYDLKRD